MLRGPALPPPPSHPWERGERRAARRRTGSGEAVGARPSPSPPSIRRARDRSTPPSEAVPGQRSPPRTDSDG
eukprot:scaffold126853_cov17-Tisochrysis_lutea.AAC.1